MHEDVVVVGVVVDHALAQVLQGRTHAVVEVGQPALDERPAARALDVVEIVADPAGAAQIPLEIAVGGGGFEAGETAIDRPQGRAQALEERCARPVPGGDFGPELPRQEGEESRPVALARGRSDFDDRRAVARRDRALQGEAGLAHREVGEHRVLQLEVRLRLAGVRDLEHEAPAREIDPEIEVAFAGERHDLAGESEALPDEASGVVRREVGQRAVDFGHGPILASAKHGHRSHPSPAADLAGAPGKLSPGWW